MSDEEILDRMCELNEEYNLPLTYSTPTQIFLYAYSKLIKKRNDQPKT